MKYYRILTTLKETERQTYSPFVFEEKEALERCTVLNITRRKGTHIPILVKKPRQMEIWDKKVHKLMGPDEMDMYVRRIEMLNSRQGRSV